MAIYGMNGMVSEAVDLSSVVESKFENPFEAAMNVVLETEMNYNNIMSAIAIDELYVLESTGVEAVYEATGDGRLSKFFGAIKKLILNIWEKIKGIFAKFLNTLKVKTTSDKDFVKKFGKQMDKINLDGFKYEGYKFVTDAIKFDGLEPDKINEVKSMADISSEENINILKKYEETMKDESYEEILDGYRGKTIGESSIKSEDYSEALFKYFRDGGDKVELTGLNGRTVLEKISNYSTEKNLADRAFTKVKRTIDNLIKDINTAESKAKKEKQTDLTSARINAYSKTSKCYKDCLQILTTFNGAYLKALKDERGQNKSIALKMLNYKKKDSTNESYSFTHSEGGSFLDTVTLI